MSNAKAIRLWGVLCISALIAACGFHLRGSYDIPAHLHAITLTAPGDSAALRNELALALSRVNVASTGGDTELEITREVLTKQTTTVDSRAKAAEYTLIYAVDYRMQRTDANAPGATQSLILRRGYQYDTTSIVGKSTEEDTLTQELRQDAAQQIVRQLRNWTAADTSAAPTP
jgi:LPS-assembly lipoprotein